MKRALAWLIGWAVDWDDSLPVRYLWTDWDVRYCTYWLWRYRLAGWFVCPFRGHNWYADMCNRREHDICERCEIRRYEAT